MPFLAKLLSFWRNLFRKNQVEQDLNDELHAYLEELAERKAQAGLDPDAAREAALMELGGMERIKALVRQQRIALTGLRNVAITAAVAVAAFISGAMYASAIPRRQAEPATASATQAVKGGPVKAKSEIGHAVVLKGRLVDSKTGQPIPGIELGLEPHPTSRRFTFTDEDGRFSFTNPPSQGYRLTAGDQKWYVGGMDSTGMHANVPPNDHFLLNPPTSVSVLTRDGQHQEGELLWNGLEPRNGRSIFSEIRKFNYSNSIIELRTEGLQPGTHGDKPDVSFKWGAVYLPGKIPGGRTPTEAQPME